MEVSFIDYLENLVETKFRGNIGDIKISSIVPDKKDIERINKLIPTKVSAMAKSIKDPIKLIRRTKAYMQQNGTAANPFFGAMRDMGFTKKQMKTLESGKVTKPIIKEPNIELPKPAPRSGKTFKAKHNNWPAIMSARVIYKGKLSAVIQQLGSGGYQDVALLGKMNGTKNVAIIGSAGDMKTTDNGLDYYSIPSNGKLPHKYDTGRGYRESRNIIILTDYVLVTDGNALTAFEDKTYTYYVFK